MPDLLSEQLRDCVDLRSVLDGALSQGLDLTGAVLGNVQMMDWTTGYLTIAVQRGFRGEFLQFFRCIRLEGGSACVRAIKRRSPVVVEDVLDDEEFLPFRGIVDAAGVRAVQSTPLISSSGALVGVLSTHFPGRHRPSDSSMRELRRIGELTANAVIRRRAQAQGAGGGAPVAERISRGSEAVARSYELLRHSVRSPKP